MRRRARLPALRSRFKSGPVTVRSMSNPRDGWTLEQALDLVARGYTPAHVEKLTEWHAKQLEAQLSRGRHPGAAERCWSRGGGGVSSVRSPLSDV